MTGGSVGLRRLFAALAFALAGAPRLAAIEPAVPLADRDLRPWTAALWMDAQGGKLAHRCSASLIDRHWVLTARHCVQVLCDETTFGKTEVRIGHIRNSDEGRPHFKIIDVVCPPVTDATPGMRWPNDVALIEIQLVFVDDARLPMVRGAPIAEAAGRLTAVGWSDRAGNTRPSAHTIELSLLPRARCNELLGDPETCAEPLVLGETQSCAWIPGGSSQTFYGLNEGDSGGPLVGEVGGRPVVVGVASQACPNSGIVVYEDVSRYRDWIAREACGYYESFSSWGAKHEAESCRERLLDRNRAR